MSQVFHCFWSFMHKMFLNTTNKATLTKTWAKTRASWCDQWNSSSASLCCKSHGKYPGHPNIGIFVFIISLVLSLAVIFDWNRNLSKVTDESFWLFRSQSQSYSDNAQKCRLCQCNASSDYKLFILHLDVQLIFRYGQASRLRGTILEACVWNIYFNLPLTY